MTYLVEEYYVLARGDFYRIRYDVDRQQKLVAENQILAALKDAELIDDDHRLIKDNVTHLSTIPSQVQCL